MNKSVTILRGDPTVAVLAEMEINTLGMRKMADWVEVHRPECLPDDTDSIWSLFPHDQHREDGGQLTDNEMLVELAGRKCYDSFGLKAGRKSNREYIEHTQSMDPPHASIMYHAKMTFFFAGVSRRVSHELIRNYVGADRDEEGSPSQESTRFTHHYGFFIMPPRYLHETTPVVARLQEHFEKSMQSAYDDYLHAVDIECEYYVKLHNKSPTGTDKKRIYEAASSFLPHQAETSFIWTTNPIAIRKFMKERDTDAADLEMRRFARTWRKVCEEHWPNFFPVAR